jgi:REP element-mobilizing transposase RayT
MKMNFVNPDHVHALIDLPTALSIEKVVQLLKGSSSHWVNSSELVTGKFAWGRGPHVCGEFIDRHGLRWHDEESR